MNKNLKFHFELTNVRVGNHGQNLKFSAKRLYTMLRILVAALAATAVYLLVQFGRKAASGMSLSSVGQARIFTTREFEKT